MMAPPVDVVGPRPRLGDVEAPPRSSLSSVAVVESEPLGRARLKGKCALGPFLSILVIECQHKCLNVNLCP
jgi:hypothetical protein